MTPLPYLRKYALFAAVAVLAAREIACSFGGGEVNPQPLPPGSGDGQGDKGATNGGDDDDGPSMGTGSDAGAPPRDDGGEKILEADACADDDAGDGGCIVDDAGDGG